MRRSIVLPAFNEADYIAEIVSQSLRAGSQSTDPFEVIVVDNASSDSTAAVVAAIAERDNRVRLVVHAQNLGYAASCLSGTRATTGDRIFILDSDGQHDPMDIWKFDAKMEEGYELVFGWRIRREEPPARLAMSKVLWGLSRIFVGFNLHDVNCGIRGFSRRFADSLVIKYQVNLVNPELFVRAKLGNFEMSEVQVIQEPRKAGVSSHDFGRLWATFRKVVSYLGSLRAELRASGADGGPVRGSGRS
jgi:glycosyltransferase involved in cell wall biosynthesis